MQELARLLLDGFDYFWMGVTRVSDGNSRHEIEK